jgi:hypothetical protein
LLKQFLSLPSYFSKRKKLRHLLIGELQSDCAAI